MTATREDRRQERAWVLRNSLWVLTSCLSLGLAGWVGFVYVAVRARDREWFVAAVLWAAWSVYLVLSLLGVATPPETRLWVMATVVQVVWQLGENPRWLRWLAAESVRAARQASGEAALVVSTDRPWLDVNTAGVDELVAKAGVDRGWAVTIVEIRSRLGRFASLEQLAAELHMPVDALADLECRLMVRPSDAGVRLEIPDASGRRLELP